MISLRKLSARFIEKWFTKVSLVAFEQRKRNLVIGVPERYDLGLAGRTEISDCTNLQTMFKDSFVATSLFSCPFCYKV